MPQWEYCSIQYDDSGALTYYFYGQQGLAEQVLYEGSDEQQANTIISQCVALLGQYDWEAITVMRRDDGMEHWYFKRRILPSNKYLTF
jgi:hypothetical protein